MSVLRDLDYLFFMAGDLAKYAESRGFKHLGLLFRMAELEAQQQAEVAKLKRTG